MKHWRENYHTCSVDEITSNHPRSNGFTERMACVAKKLMDKAGSKGKPWISGLFDYRVTPQTGSIASPLQLMIQCRPRKKSLPQLPSALCALEMHQTHQELIRRQGNKAGKEYQELLPGTLVHKYTIDISTVIATIGFNCH